MYSHARPRPSLTRYTSLLTFFLFPSFLSHPNKLTNHYFSPSCTSRLHFIFYLNNTHSENEKIRAHRTHFFRVLVWDTHTPMFTGQQCRNLVWICPKSLQPVHSTNIRLRFLINIWFLVREETRVNCPMLCVESLHELAPHSYMRARSWLWRQANNHWAWNAHTFCWKIRFHIQDYIDKSSRWTSELLASLSTCL